MIPCPRVKLVLVFLAVATLAAPALAQPEAGDPAPPGAEPAPVAPDEPAAEPPPEPSSVEPAPPPAGAPPPASYPLEAEGPPPTATDPTSDIRRHDGFYARIALGIGLLALRRDSSSPSTDAAYGGESEVKGVAGVTEISIGGTVADGLVLCGSLLGHALRDATLEREGRADLETKRALSFGMVGMGVHYFPDDRGGFHAGGTLGLAYAVAEVSASRFERIGGAGIGASLASGYDWWVSDQWALGVIGRLTVARLQGEVAAGGVTAQETDMAGAFGVMFSVLHH
jgi:hypothetical protein